MADTSALQEKMLKDLPTKWDLTELFADDEAYDAAIKRGEELIPAFEAEKGTFNSVEGFLHDLENPETLEFLAIMNRAIMYASFLTSLNSTDPRGRNAMAKIMLLMQKLGLANAYKEPEIMAMPLEKRQEILSDGRLAPYAYSLKDYADPNHVYLDEQASMVQTLMESGFNSQETRTIFDNVELPRPTFTYPDGEEGTLTDEVYYNIMESKKYGHEFRKRINGLRNAMRAPFANTYASLLEGDMKARWANAQIMQFDSTLNAALHENDVNPMIYDKIIAFAHSLSPKISTYYALKKELLGLDEFCSFDVGQSVNAYEAKQVSYEDAANTARRGVSVWGDEYLKLFDRIIQRPHIDVYPGDAKSSGAFMKVNGNETEPFVLFNFDGSETYASTIAHEMGHAVYGLLALENQNVYNNQPTIFTHEVASTANEVMLYKYLIAHAASKEEELFWMDRHIDDYIATIMRQCMYSEFEDYCYKTIESGGSLDAEAMNQKWLELMKVYYGEAVTVNDDEGIDWARIPHLYSGYYVYKYATSITYATAICELVEEKGQEEIDAYFDFLKAGKTADPASLLAIAGVDPLSDDTYKTAADYIGKLVDEYVALSKE